MSKFINLHVHSEFSILDGCGRQADFIQRAGEMGQEALAFTDHGTLRGVYNFHKKVQGIKPLFGIEFYLAPDHKVKGLPEEEIQAIKSNLDGKGKGIIKKALQVRGEEMGIRKTNHLTVLAKTNQGLKNLYRLASIGWLEGFYYRPRIDFDLLNKFGDGLIVLSGCLQGMISQLLLEDKIEEALELAEVFQDRWGEDFYLEIMPNSIPDQAKVNRALVQISQGLAIPLVATIDVHYPRRSDWRAHDLLLCVNTKKKMNDPERWRFSAQDFWLHSRKEVLAGFKVHHPSIPRETVLKAIASTEEIAGKCEASLEVDTGALFIPDPLDTENDFQELMSLSWEGWDSRDIPGRAEVQGLEVYLDRLKKELTQIRKQKVSKYFLVVWDLCKWVRSQHIACGPGRGSAGGCLVAYLLRITDIDPVAHGLLFERFLSPERIDIPDIDLDFEDRRRGEIIGYLKEKYGEECVCQISTVSAMKGRLCLRDIGRALDLPYGEVDQVAASLVIKDEERDKPILEEAFTNIPVCQAFNRKHPEVLPYAKVLECQARNLGLHAAGVLVSSVPLQEIIPLESRKYKGGERVVCSGWDMKGCEAAGLLKIDILGLRNLSVNADCLQAIKERYGDEPDLEGVSLEDPDVLQQFSDGHFIGIFQFDTSSAAAMSKGVNFERFEDIVAMVALDRPGTARSGLATQFLERKADPSKRKPFHPIVDSVCEDTHGVLVYQEQISKLFIELAGYSPGEADGVRKAVGKKLGLGGHEKRFVREATKKGMSKEDAEKLIGQIRHFGAYGFNLAHSTAYALTAYRQMWLKKYFPVQFMWALMKNEPDRHQIRRFLGEARRLEIEVTAPMIESSGEDFRISEDNSDVINCGLADIKGIGPAAIKSIVEISPFESFPDFINRTNTRAVNKRVVEVLAKAGALQGYIPNLKWFLENFDEIWKKRTSKGFPDWWGEEKEKSKSLLDYTEEEKAILASEVSPFGGGGHPIEPFKSDLDQWRILWSDLGDEIWERPWAWVRGVIVASKYARVGDYHSGEDHTEEEKKRRGWGKQFATLNLEGLEGSQKVKVGWDRMSPDLRTVIDQGVGTSVIALLAINAPYKSLQVRVLWPLKEMWEKAKAEKLNLFERSVIQSKGLLKGHKAQDLTRRVLLGGKKRSGVAVVVSIIERIDKNLRLFARIGFWGISGFLEAVCFSSNWDSIQKRVSEGQLVEVKVESSGMGWVIKDLEVLRSGLTR